jgi:hypothetical protein
MSRDTAEIKHRLNVSFAQAGQFKAAMEYLDNVGECKTAWFDEDFDPIGPQTRADMMKHGALIEREGLLFPAF